MAPFGRLSHCTWASTPLRRLCKNWSKRTRATQSALPLRGRGKRRREQSFYFNPVNPTASSMYPQAARYLGVLIFGRTKLPRAANLASGTATTALHRSRQSLARQTIMNENRHNVGLALISLRSNSAKPPRTVSMRRPCGVVVSPRYRPVT